MRNPLRVALVTRSLMMGGTQRHIVKLCKELVSEHVAICVCLLINDEPRDLVGELPPEVKVYTFPHRRHDPRTLVWLASIFRREKTEVVHSFSWHADFYSSLLKVVMPRLVVLGSERGDRGTRNFYTTFYQRIDQWLVFRLADGFCANSHFGERLLAAYGCEPRKIEVIHNGVNLATIDQQPTVAVRRLNKWPESSTVCCLVSRLVDYKGIDNFIRSVKLCQQDLRFVIVGDGPERIYLMSLVQELDLSDRVAFTGQINPATPFIKDADICVLPTKESEHCSNSILEYMASAKPVIAMDVGGNSELIIPGLTGFLINPGHMERIPAVLDQLALNKQLAIKLGLAGRKRIEEAFQMREIAARFCSLWNSYLVNKGFN